MGGIIDFNFAIRIDFFCVATFPLAKEEGIHSFSVTFSMTTYMSI